jgi:uridylate kinase
MYEKEANNKLRLECGRVTEDKVQMHSQFLNALTLNEKLEKEVSNNSN